MKRFLTILLALTLALTCVFAMTACTEEEEPKKESEAESEAEDTSSGETVSTPKEYVLADGYKLYTKEDISFAYPKDWTLTDGALPVMQDANGNNINMTYESASRENTELYKSLTNETYMELVGAAYEAMGMTIVSYDVKTVTNEYGVELIRCTCSLEYQDIQMKMYQFIVLGEENHYVITITELTDISKVVDELFKSITLA